MCDLISRQKAIEALCKDSCGSGWCGVSCREVVVIENLPSAQTEVANDTNVLNNDCISRQAAIDAILAVTGNSSVRELYEHVQEHGLSDMWSGGVNAAIDIIIAVPSAQPEIVRCGECKHMTPEGRCLEFADDNLRPSASDFCSYAERKTMTREEAMNVLKANYPDPCFSDLRKAVDMAIKALEQPEPKWIPCKERLPDKDGLYLVTYFSGHARWTGTDEFLVDGTEESHWKYANIIAWQPLPKPFREGGDYA